MKGNYLITNTLVSHEIDNLLLLKTVGNYHIYANPKMVCHELDDLIILIHGYVLPRNEYFHQYKSLPQPELVKRLYDNFESKFVNYIKGIYTIIIVCNDSIDIYTDHFGLQSFYIYKHNRVDAISDSINLFGHIGHKALPDINSIAVKSILHRVPSPYSIYENVMRSNPATHLTISEIGIKSKRYWKPECLLDFKESGSETLHITDFVALIKENFNNFLIYTKPAHHAITLTGGKDSRTGLASLKSLGISPHGFTYGNPFSSDAVFAGKLAKETSTPHHIFSPTNDEGWINSISKEICDFGNPDISFHRAHRLYAFKEMTALFSGVAGYYAGYMAGEFLMGPYYDDLIFTRSLTDFWDSSVKSSSQPLLDSYFHKFDKVNFEVIISRLDKLRSFDSTLPIKKRQFYGLFEIGIPHHGQDIFLAGNYFDYVYPFFIDIDFLEILFKSRFCFLYNDNKSISLLKRYELYEFNLKIQHLLMPEMDTVPFGKRGSYNTKEFLKGKFYWTALRTLRYLTQQRKYPATYKYNETYRNYICEYLKELNAQKGHLLHEYFDIPKAISSLHTINHDTGEGVMHRFSNIVMLYLQIKRFE
ncbi:MAG: hypothetical protein ACFCUM_19060 [Bacteroidales bacterium]